MRNWIIVGIILLIVGLVGAGVTFGAKGDFSFGTEKIARDQSIDAEGIRNIEVKTGSIDVSVVPGSGNKAVATLSGRVSKKYSDKMELKLEKDGDTLRVGFADHVGFTFGLNFTSLDLKLEVPQRQYDRLKLNAGSGDSDLNGLQAASVEIDSGSGDVELKGMKGSTISVSIGSGELSLSDITVDGAITTKGGSGDVDIDRIEAKSLDVNLSSGEAKIADAVADVNVDTGSGDIRLKQQALDRPATLKTGSGEVSVKTSEKPADAAFSFSAGSGDIHIGWKGVQSMKDEDGVLHLVFGNGSVPIKVHTGSGDLSIGSR